MEEQQPQDKPAVEPVRWDLNDIEAYKQLSDESQSLTGAQASTSRDIVQSNTFYFTHTAIGVGLTFVTGLLAKSALDGNIAIALLTMGLIIYMPWIFGLYAAGAFVVELARWVNRPR